MSISLFKKNNKFKKNFIYQFLKNKLDEYQKNNTKLLSFLYTVSSLFFSSFILLKIEKMPMDKETLLSAVWKVILVFLILFSAKMFSYNLHISFGKQLIDFLVFFIYLAYTLSIIFLAGSKPVNDYSDLLEFILWYLIVMVINLVWKITFIVFEWKKRPFFAQVQCFKLISIISFSGIMIIFYFFINNLDGFSFSDFKTNEVFLTYVSLLLLMFFLIFFSEWKIANISSKITIFRIVNRRFVLSNSFKKILPLTIWIFTYFDWNAIKINSLPTVAITSSLIFILGIWIVPAKIMNKAPKNILFIITTSILIVSMTGFINLAFLNGNQYVVHGFLMLFIFFISFLIMLTKPEAGAIFVFFYRIFVFYLFFYTLFILLLFTYISNSSFLLPFELEIMVYSPIFAIILFIEGLHIFTLWHSFFLISRYHKTYFLKKEKKSKKLMKGSLNG